MFRSFGSRISLAAAAIALLVIACRDLTAPDSSLKHAGSGRSLQNPSGTVVVYPDSMRGWVFYNDQINAVCPTGTACRMVQGPATPPLGAGSAELYDSLATDGKALILVDYAGTRFDSITDLHYSTYRQTADAGNNLAISLQFNVDYDLNDAATGWYGRLVFEPYVGIGGNVPQDTWQTWDAKAGKWWGTKSTVTRNGASVTNPCVQATPCTWAQILTMFPNVGVHSVYGAVILKAGSGWPGFRGNVDELTLGVTGTATTFDFELTPRPSMPPFPDSVPPAPNWAYVDSLPLLSLSPNVPDGDLAVGGVILVTFRESANTTDKQFVRDSLLRADLLGAWKDDPATLSTYYFRVRDSLSADSLVARASRVAADTRVLGAEVLTVRNKWMPSYRVPKENPTYWSQFFDRLGSGVATATPTNALNLVRAPLAWGCAAGDGRVRLGVYDQMFSDVSDLRPNLKRVWGGFIEADPNTPVFLQHGERVAAILAAAGDNGEGMTGMTWNAQVKWMWQTSDSTLSDTARIDPLDREKAADVARENLVRLGQQVDIINYSVTPTFGDSVQPAMRTNRRLSSYRLLSNALRKLATKGRYPVVVVAAGNDTQDAELAGAPSVVNEFPSQVIVVGGALNRIQVDPGANFGSTIDIYAPSVNVGSLKVNNVVTADATGTSFATPLVAGTLALLISFDPRLDVGSSEAQAAKLKSLLISGSSLSAERINGKPVLDAYAVLRRAAMEPGAPLCGNRVYRAASDVIAERDSTVETLIHDAALSEWDYGYLNVLHGGRSIQYAGGTYEYLWGPSSQWTLNPVSDSSAARERDWSSAAYNGLLGYSHDRNVAAGIYPSTNATSATVRIAFQDSSGVREFFQGFPFVGTSTPSCDRFRVSDQSCYRVTDELHGLAVSPNFNSGAVGTIAPLGDYVLMAVNFSRQHVTYGAPRACTQWETPRTDSLGNELLCADRLQADTSDHVEFYRVSRTGSITGFSSPGQSALALGKTVNWIALNERGTEAVMSTSTTAVQNLTSMSCGAEEMVWVPVSTGGFAGAAAAARHAGQAAGCEGYYFGGGSFAPMRGTVKPPSVQAAPTRRP